MKIMDNEKRLVKKILNGNKSAFKTLVHNYEKLVWHIVYRLIPKTSDRQDLCQDIFIRIYQYLPQFKYESKLSTWIGKIAYNTCLNFIEKRKTLFYDDLTQGSNSFDSLAGSELQPDDFVETNNISKLVQQEIARLPLNYKAIITFFHLDEMSYQEISDIMGMPEGTVKSYLFRARKLLKNRLVSKYQSEDIL